MVVDFAAWVRIGIGKKTFRQTCREHGLVGRTFGGRCAGIELIERGKTCGGQDQRHDRFHEGETALIHLR